MRTSATIAGALLLLAATLAEALGAAASPAARLAAAPLCGAFSAGELSGSEALLPGLMPLDDASGQPVPYRRDEFPGWMWDIRRAEVVTVGAFPITLLFSSLGYQLYRSIEGVSTPITQPEQIGVLLGGVGLAATVAIIDFILGKIQPPPKKQEAP